MKATIEVKSLTIEGGPEESGNLIEALRAMTGSQPANVLRLPAALKEVLPQSPCLQSAGMTRGTEKSGIIEAPVAAGIDAGSEAVIPLVDENGAPVSLPFVPGRENEKKRKKKVGAHGRAPLQPAGMKNPKKGKRGGPQDVRSTCQGCGKKLHFRKMKKKAADGWLCPDCA